MTIVVFCGPSLPAASAPATPGVVYEAPARAGDILRVLDYRPTAIALIDGFFEIVPAVWHKELLFAMSEGVHVLGAASMGALRAAELHTMGMQGVGAIFRAYVNGAIEDDDEVAVVHGPPELGYPCLSEPMVNIRRTISDALAAKVITPSTKMRLEVIAKQLHYKDRDYSTVLDLASKDGLDEGELESFWRWLPTGRVDQKRLDAMQLLARLTSADVRKKREPTQFNFEETVFWSRLAGQRYQ